MAMRRPRIKPVANILLNSKRKPKPINEVKSGNVGAIEVKDAEYNKKISSVVEVEEKENSSGVIKLLEVGTESLYDTIANVNNLNKSNDDPKTIEVTDTDNVHKVVSKEENRGERNCENVSNINKSEADFKNNGLTDEQNEHVKAKKEKSVETNCENVTKVEILCKTLNGLSSKDEHTKQKGTLNDSEAFKFPPKVGFQRTVSQTSNSGIDDVFYSDIEENALQMDLEKSPINYPSSPSKNMGRTRIRPTLHFGQRRNSFVGSSPSSHTSANEENYFPNNSVNNDVAPPTPTRRERHHSTPNIGNSPSLHHHTPHKYLPAGITNGPMGRIRTESGCSVFSDTSITPQKMRKIDDHKQNTRKDFEARFENGVPERSVIKMSDLIYYNPFTNPMEQKPKPNVKIEQNGTSANDVKPFSAKQEMSTDKLTNDTEAIPVPQLKLNAQGELILDDKSLVIETTAEQEARKVLANSSLIYLDEYTGMNGFYSRRKRSRDWIASDTIKFYRCLQTVGTDFSLMVALFPNRTRRDLKLKFKYEEKRNNHLINKALLYPKQFDIESLKQLMDEEEKLREVQNGDKKKKVKKEKKKINCHSKATRILVNEVYQNETIQKENRISKPIRGKNKPKNEPEIEKITVIHNDSVETEETEAFASKEPEKIIKTKKPKKSVKLSEVEKLIKREYDNEKRRMDRYYANKRRRKKQAYKWRKKKTTSFIKTEFKTENKRESVEVEFQDTKQLEMEIDVLLDMDAVDVQYDNVTYESSTTNMFYSSTPQADQHNEEFNMNSQSTTYTDVKPLSADTIENDLDYEHTTLVNLDDGSLNVYSNIKDDIVFITSPQLPTSLSPTNNENDSSFDSSITTEIEILNPESCTSVGSEPDLNEADIQSILTELADGSLVLVSSLHPDDPDKVLNEIYMVDKATGDLCEEPLRIPDNIVQCILAVLS